MNYLRDKLNIKNFIKPNNFEASKIEPENIQKIYILSNIVTYENPVKPKKALILLISCFVGFLLSIFGVLIWDVAKNRN
ncbi:GNVR domain-containing protein [uncultured Campylobacter sp.]|uniref:GNVR domain-containing protein n=1 Tax=uncultured Campylobacter sp. TaxID=218934 RepID=UPI00345BFB03